VIQTAKMECHVMYQSKGGDGMGCHVSEQGMGWDVMSCIRAREGMGCHGMGEKSFEVT
jgi:hypothetical protein